MDPVFQTLWRAWWKHKCTYSTNGCYFPPVFRHNSQAPTQNITLIWEEKMVLKSLGQADIIHICFIKFTLLISLISDFVSKFVQDIFLGKTLHDCRIVYMHNPWDRLYLSARGCLLRSSWHKSNQPGQLETVDYRPLMEQEHEQNV